MMDTYCTFVQTHSMYTTRSVPCCKLWALDGVTCQCRFTILTTWWGCWHRGNYACVGPGGTWGISLLPLRFVTSLVAQMVKNLPAMGRPGFDPWVGKIPWRRKWQPTPVSCLENPMDGGAWRGPVHGINCKESNTTERLTLSLFSFQTILEKYSLKAILGIGKYFIIELTSMHRGVIFSHAIYGINIQSSSEGSVTFCGVFYRKSHGFLCIWVHHPMEMSLLVMSGSHYFIIVLLSSFFFFFFVE